MNTDINYPEWVPEEYIEAETLWEKAKSLEVFEDTDEQFLIDEYLTDPIQDMRIKDYPVAHHNWRRVEVYFGEYDVGQKQLQVTWDIDAAEIKSKSLHEAGREDMNWLCDPDDIRIAGVDDEKVMEDMGYDDSTSIGRRDNPYGQTD